MGNINAIINRSELDFISNCVLDYPELETGGDLFGFWTKEGYPVVQYVIGPGYKTTRTSTSFYQDIEYLRKCGEFLNGKFGLEHIGGWHSHHKLSLAQPSGGDISTMRKMFKDNSHERFLISISNIQANSKVKVNAFLFERNNPQDYTTCSWKVLDVISPVREAILKMNVDLFTNPSAEHADIDYEDAVKENKAEKVELVDNSFFKTKAGQKFLKKEFEKIKNHSDCKNVEIVQNEDKTIGITFNYRGKDVEIRYPNDFSEENPVPVIIEKENDQEIKQHVIEVKPSRFYILSPFNIIKECRRVLFGVKIEINEGSDKGGSRNIPIE